MDYPVQQMGTLLSRMTGEKESVAPLDNAQVSAMVEIVIPGVLKTPGMPAGMTCEFIERDEKSWTLRITRP